MRSRYFLEKQSVEGCFSFFEKCGILKKINTTHTMMQKIFLAVFAMSCLSFGFFPDKNAFAVSCEGAAWGGTYSGECKRTCEFAPKETGVTQAAQCKYDEGELCCVKNPNIGKACTATGVSGVTRSGTCAASASDCAQDQEGVSGNPCSSTNLMCCVPKESSGGACVGTYSSGKQASGTCSEGGACPGGKISVGACQARGTCCASPEGPGGGTTPGGGGGGGGTTPGGGGGGSTGCSGGGMMQIGPTYVPGEACLPKTSISSLLVFLLQWLLYIFGFLSVLAFVVSGIMYVTSAGDDSMIDRAKTYMVWSIVGIIVALSGLVVINAINSWLQNGLRYF